MELRQLRGRNVAAKKELGYRPILLSLVFLFLLFTLLIINGCKPGITGAAVVSNSPAITITNTLTTSDSAYIVWDTDIAASSIFNSSVKLQIYNFGSEFDVVIEDLSSDTTYTYLISACDNSSICNFVYGNFSTKLQQDDTAPVITIDVVVGTDSANISWQTDEQSNATFEFNGETTGYGFDISFEKLLSGLNLDSTYNYNIHFCDTAENCDSTTGQFTSSAELDITAPGIIFTISKDSTTANISWQTNEQATSTFSFYGTNTTYNLDSSFEKYLSLLEPETSYIFGLTSCDESANCQSINSEFITDSIDALVISIININTTLTNATINWQTSKSATSRFHYSNVLYVFSENTEFSLFLTNLGPNNTYIFNLSACADESCTYILRNFTTLSEQKDGPIISVDIITDHNSSDITWTTSESSNCTLVIDGDEYFYDYSTVFEQQVDLAENSSYDINITCCNSNANCQDYGYRFTTSESPDSKDPVISMGDIIIGESSITFSWTTDELTLGNVYFNATKTDFGLNTSFTHTINGLSKGIDYSFVVSACDSVDNCDSLSRDFSLGAVAQAEQPKEEEVVTEIPPVATNPETVEEFKVSKPTISGSAVAFSLKYTAKPGFFTKASKLAFDHILLTIFSIIIIATVIFNVAYYSISRSQDHYNDTLKLIRKAGFYIKLKQMNKAYQLYPSILSAYKNIDKPADKQKLERIMKVLYTQLQLHYAMTNAENLTTLYIAGNIDENKLNEVEQNLDAVPELLLKIKQMVHPRHHHALDSHFMERHTNCMKRIIEMHNNKK